MAKPKPFVIKLAGNKSMYTAGSSVEGSVSLELSKPEQSQGISIVFSGIAHTHWVGGHSRHTGYQILFPEIFKQLWGNDKDPQELAAGRYEFPFKFQLPSDRALPSSFESDSLGYGSISYLLLAHMKRSWKLDL